MFRARRFVRRGDIDEQQLRAAQVSGGLGNPWRHILARANKHRQWQRVDQLVEFDPRSVEQPHFAQLQVYG